MSLTPMTINQQLALKIVAKRKWLRLTQAELAKRAGISRTALAKMESGQGNPTVSAIQAIVNALDTDITLFARPQREPGFTPKWLMEGQSGRATRNS